LRTGGTLAIAGAPVTAGTKAVKARTPTKQNGQQRHESSLDNRKRRDAATAGTRAQAGSSSRDTSNRGDLAIQPQGRLH
jgi:hypothetical protein